MQARQWDKIKAIFAEAAALDSERRGAYLDEACKDDPGLRSEVDRLLGHHQDSATTEIFDQARRHSLQPNEVLGGRFRILRFLGRGGMGEVYGAEDLELGGSVALKVLRPEFLDDPQFLGRFRREVQLARQVSHPNVCRIFDVGHDYSTGRERVFFTMEFLEGETLAACLRRAGRLSEPAALPLVSQIADGLAALHERGIVHRDLKPGNVMLVQGASGSTRAVVSDLGLARATIDASGRDALSRPGNVFGTVDYMAPEQLMGKDVSPATDLYAFGLVMYEMVTGVRPFPGGQGLENAVRRLTEPPEPPRKHVADLSPEWEAIILRCLEKEPANRPESADEVVRGLMGSSQFRRLHAPVISRGGKSKWVAWCAGIAAALALLFLVLRFIWQPGGSHPARQHLAVLPLTVLEGEGDLRVFADGLMDTITRRLSQYEGPESSLLVVPASEVRQQDARSARDAAKKFGATAVVEGSLQGQGDRVRLLLTLVDTREMRQKETMIVEEKRANALALQDAAVSKLANALSLRVQPRHARDLSPVAPGAYEFYLQARGYLQRSDKLANIENAIGLFRRALEMDERYAPAYSGLGEAYWYKFERTRDQAFIQEALKSCGRALALNAGLPEAQIAMGRIHLGTGRHDEALRDFEKALAVDNRNSEAYQGLANTYSSLKQFEKAEATYRQAISLRPADWTGYKQLGLYYYRRGEFDKAIEQYDKVVALTPDNAQGYVNLGAFQFRKEDFRAAQKSWERALELDPDRISTLTNLAKLHAELGEYPQAIKLYERALKVNDRSFLLWGNLGAAYKRVGLEGKAAPALETAIHLVESELSVNPKRGDLYSYLAFYHAMAGRSKKVEGLLSKAFALAPDDPDILARAAETAELLGKRDQAMGFLRSAVAKGQPVENLKRSPILRGLADQLTREANPNSK